MVAQHLAEEERREGHVHHDALERQAGPSARMTQCGGHVNSGNKRPLDRRQDHQLALEVIKHVSGNVNSVTQRLLHYVLPGVHTL